MSEIIFREEFRVNRNFLVVVVFEKNKCWLILFETLKKDFIGFWSTNTDKGFLPVEDFVKLLKELLAGADKVRTIYDATTVFPKGWDYWGSFVPQPINSFIDYDFEKLVNNVS